MCKTQADLSCLPSSVSFICCKISFSEREFCKTILHAVPDEKPTCRFHCVEKTVILEHKKVAILCTKNGYIVTMLVLNVILKLYTPLYCT